jgi:hypothetical protein
MTGEQIDRLRCNWLCQNYGKEFAVESKRGTNTYKHDYGLVLVSMYSEAL